MANRIELAGLSWQAQNDLAYALRQGMTPAAPAPVAAPVHIDLSSLTFAVGSLGDHLYEIAELLTNPTHVEADERYRRGITAFRSGWFDEALLECSASTEIYPYRAAPYLLAGAAQLELDQSPGAWAQFCKAAKYAKAEDPDHGATAGIVGALMVAAIGEWSRAAEILETAAQSAPSSVEVALARYSVANRQGEPIHELRNHLTQLAVHCYQDLDPELAAAISAECPLIAQLHGSKLAPARRSGESTEHFYRSFLDQARYRYTADENLLANARDQLVVAQRQFDKHQAERPRIPFGRWLGIGIWSDSNATYRDLLRSSQSLWDSDDNERRRHTVKSHQELMLELSEFDQCAELDLEDDYSSDSSGRRYQRTRLVSGFDASCLTLYQLGMNHPQLGPERANDDLLRAADYLSQANLPGK